MILALKLILSPLLIVLITMAARRWGYGVAGWLSGLPTTSGPISLILALQHGTAFVAHAALGALAGLVGSIGFCLIYAWVAIRRGPIASMMAGFVAYAIILYALHGIAFSVTEALALVIGALVVGLVLMPRRPPPVSLASPWWDLPARIAAALFFVLLLTGLSSWLGPSMSGLLSPFPLAWSIIAVFAHRAGGRDAALGFFRGVLIGGFSFVAFTLVVVTRLEVDGLIAYVTAVAAALAVNGATYVATALAAPRAPAVAAE